MRLQTIRDGLAAQLRTNLTERAPTVFAYDPEARTGHNITILPADEYVTFQTIGPNWEANILLDLRIEVPGRLADAQIAMDDYLSAGTGSASSVIDAVHLSSTLGGLVEDCSCISVDGPDLTVDPLTAVVHVRIMTSRGA